MIRRERHDGRQERQHAAALCGRHGRRRDGRGDRTTPDAVRPMCMFVSVECFGQFATSRAPNLASRHASRSVLCQEAQLDIQYLIH